MSTAPALQPTIACPNPGTSLPLTDALAAPLIAATQKEYEARLEAQRGEFDQARVDLDRREREAADAARAVAQQQVEAKRAQEDLQAERARLEQEIARRTGAAVETALEQRLLAERKAIAEAEERRAAQRFADKLAAGDRDRADQADRIAELTRNLTASQKAQADLQRRERELQDRERERPLEIEREVNGRLDQVRAVAVAEASERLTLQLSDKERQIRELADKLEEASRKAQQGSQQAQGETLELLLEDQLRRQFPFDELQPVPKGEYGGDTLHVVRDSTGRECGRILWEFKRTKTWQAAWLGKLKGDQRSARADIAVLVSQAMPPDVQHFNEVDGVWISSLSCTLPVATALRASLLQLAGQRRNAAGQQTKSELVYAYLTGPQFRGRIAAISERWTEMQKDLADEKKATLTRWAKREKQLSTLIESTAGIHGDLEGITGRDLAEIEALGETLLLE